MTAVPLPTTRLYAPHVDTQRDVNDLARRQCISLEISHGVDSLIWETDAKLIEWMQSGACMFASPMLAEPIRAQLVDIAAAAQALVERIDRRNA